MERQTLAYLMLAVLAGWIIGWASFLWHHGGDRTYRRRQSRERMTVRAQLAAKKSPAR